MTRPFLSVVIPAYNEAERLPLTLIDIDRHLAETEYSYEIIVVNDGSNDGTKEIVERLGSVVKNLKLIDNPEHRGKGSAVRVAMRAARGTWRLMLDADNAVSVVEFSKIIPEITGDRRIHIFAGSRELRGGAGGSAFPLARRIGDSAVNRIIRLITRSNISDFFTGFHCFSDEAAEAIFSTAKVDGWGYAAEALAIADRLGYAAREVHVAATHIPDSSVTFPHYLQILAEVIKIRWWFAIGKYEHASKSL